MQKEWLNVERKEGHSIGRAQWCQRGLGTVYRGSIYAEFLKTI